MMNNNYENKELKLNYDMKGHKKDTVLLVKVDKEGVPVDRYWRDRVKESTKDDCVSWVDKKKGGK